MRKKPSSIDLAMHMACDNVSLNQIQARSPRLSHFTLHGLWKLNMNHLILSRHIQDPQEARKVIGVHKVFSQPGDRTSLAVSYPYAPDL